MKKILFFCFFSISHLSAVSKDDLEQRRLEFEKFQKNIELEEGGPLTRQPASFSTNGMVMLIDKTEKNGTLGFASTLLYALIEQEAAPVFTTTSLFYNTLSHADFQPNRWICKKVGTYFYLLIPKKYLNALKKPGAATRSTFSRDELSLGLKINAFPTISDNDMAQESTHKIAYPKNFDLSREFSRYAPKLFITNREYAQNNASAWIPRWTFYIAGHGTQYKTIDEEIKKLEDEYKNPTKYLSEKDKRNIKAAQIVALKTQIRKEINTWKSKKARGEHYQEKGKLAAVKLVDMKAFLTFLEEKLTVKLVVLMTCFGASLNLRTALSETNSNLHDFFGLRPTPFILVSGASSGSPIYAFTKQDAPYRFDLFFSYLQKPYTASQKPGTFTNVNEALSHVYSYYDAEHGFSSIDTYANIPLIKKAGQEWISVVDLPEKIVSIGNIMTVRTKPLNVSRFFAGRIVDGKKGKDKVYPDALFVYPKKVPFTVIFSAEDDDTKHPAIISATLDMLHTFEHIQSKDFDLDEVVDAFFRIKELKENKIFHIKKLTVQRDDDNPLPGSEEILTLNDVIIANLRNIGSAPTKKTISFKYNDQWWQANLNKGNLYDQLKKIPQQNIQKQLDKIQALEAKVQPKYTELAQLFEDKLSQKQEEQAEKIKRELEALKNLEHLTQSLAELAEATKTQKRGMKQ